ncbi:MAG: ankyrin repeat domain-containing protein [Flavobacteriales bacterium]|nr:ankyrin repeat domain-containing protein [Flavobacteriales bacterium]
MNDLTTVEDLVSEGMADLDTTRNATGQTILIHAISSGKLDAAKSLIAMGASATVAGADGKTPMDLAAGKGDAELVGALIDGGAQVNTAHIDAAMGNPAVVSMMVSKSNNPANASHAVNAALAKGNTELFKSLVESNGVPLTNAHYESAVNGGRSEIALYVLEAPGIDYNAALGASLAKANKPLIERCLDKGAAPAPALGWAVDKGDIPFATMCITQYGADVNGALPQAVAKGSAPMVNMLLDNGAEASRGLQSAVASGSLPMATLLLDRGADATAATACLQTAVDNGSLPMATLLIERGADANGQMANASGRGNDAMVKLLIAKGGDPNTGMAAAVRKDKASTVEVLVNSGADPAPAVGYAVGKGNAPMLDLLISKGADVTKPDLVKTAVRRKDTATLLVLLEKGRASADPGMALAVDSLGEDIVGILLNHNADATPDRYIKKAVERKSVPIATLLLAKGADANNGVLLAIQKNDLDMVTLLKSNNGDLSRAGYLAASVGFDNFPLSTLIVDAGCPVQEGVDPAVTAGAGKVMGLLVDKGADVKNVDLIARAVNGAFPGVVEALLRGGCDPKEHIDPATGGNLMHVAAMRNDFPTVKLLFGAGVNMHYKAAGSGDVPLHAAVRGRNNNDMVAFMVETGQADVNAVNAKGKSVLQESPAGSGIPKYLKSKGAEKKPEK